MTQVWTNIILVNCVSLCVIYWEHLRRQALGINDELYTKRHWLAIHYWCFPDYPVIIMIGVSAIPNWFVIASDVHIGMRILASMLYAVFCVAAGFLIGRSVGRLFFGQASTNKEFIMQRNSKK